jgi:hypothetical protein
VTTLLTQLGLDVGVTDVPWMPYFDPPGDPGAVTPA